ncbi:putative pollen-specific leucine-rich repeat extensin-like protein 3 [Iris pallida]|uniref:Pollen-specific leucine-rich repeat extensin-like protein 3 n=1 Tax=Iris pallida TaxID=29817 RepID=A0AAX6H4J4_IRIPA|nr:putative pollen-specific leucine-rich repeat extensin-like protein 3 [Iris pallida]
MRRRGGKSPPASEGSGSARHTRWKVARCCRRVDPVVTANTGATEGVIAQLGGEVSTAARDLLAGQAVVPSGCAGDRVGLCPHARDLEARR